MLKKMRTSFVDIGGKVCSLIKYYNYRFNHVAGTIQVLGDEFKERQKVIQLRRDFIEEMRLISKLRHPCITTVLVKQIHICFKILPPLKLKVALE